jgi:hypothetical protein
MYTLRWSGGAAMYEDNHSNGASNMVVSPKMSKSKSKIYLGCFVLHERTDHLSSFLASNSTQLSRRGRLC